MIKTTLLVLISTVALSQSVTIITSQKTKTSTDINAAPGSSGTISLTDTTKFYHWIPSGGATVLNWSVPATSVVTDSVTVDSNPPQTGLTYSTTGWTHATNTCCGWASNTLSYNSTVGSMIIYTFTGNKLTWWSEHASNKGKVNIQVDAEAVKTITLTGTEGVDVVRGKPSFVWKGPTGSHTIRITKTSDVGDVAHDRFTYTFIR